MFKLKEKVEVNRSILKCDYNRYSPSEISTINTANSQNNIDLPREDSVISLLNKYLDLNFDGLHAASGNIYANDKDKRLVNFGLIALFSKSKLTTSSGKHLQAFTRGYIVSLMHKLITSARGSDCLSIGFDRDRNRRQRELTKNKKLKRNYHLRIMLRDIFGFAQHQGKATYGLGYELVLTRSSDNSVLNKDSANNNDEIEINLIEWYIPHYTPSIPQRAILSKEILSKVPSDFQYVESSVFMKKVYNQNLCVFQFGTQKGLNVPIWIIVGFNTRKDKTRKFYTRIRFIDLL